MSKPNDKKQYPETMTGLWGKDNYYKSMPIDDRSLDQIMAILGKVERGGKLVFKTSKPNPEKPKAPTGYIEYWLPEQVAADELRRQEYLANKKSGNNSDDAF